MNKILIISLIIVVILISGCTTKEILSSNEFTRGSERWVPNGKSISYLGGESTLENFDRNVRYEGSSYIYYIYEKDIKNFVQQKLIELDESEGLYHSHRIFEYSPDGSKIVYSSGPRKIKAFTRGTGTSARVEFEDVPIKLVIYDLITDSKKDLIVFETDKRRDLVEFSDLRWSPDGKKILFEVVSGNLVVVGGENDGKNLRIGTYLINSDGANLTELFRRVWNDDKRYIMLPDGSTIYVGLTNYETYWFGDPEYVYVDLRKKYTNYSHFISLTDMSFAELKQNDLDQNICENSLDTRRFRNILVSPDGMHYLEREAIVWIELTGYYNLKLKKSGDKLCEPLDTDLDGIPNYLDTDKDGDGFSDYDEINSWTSILDSSEYPS